MTEIPVNLVVEDSLSEVVLRVMLKQSGKNFTVGAVHGKKGNSYIREKLPAFNGAARYGRYLVLTDLDRNPCAPQLFRDWLVATRQPNLLFRVTVREVESWLLAHRKAFSEFLGIAEAIIPENVDDLDDPKQVLVNLARRSPRKALREAIVPGPKTVRQTGPDYNGRLISFVYQMWQVRVARQKSPSLDRAIKAISKFGSI